jgi:hypothetical protein
MDGRMARMDGWRGRVVVVVVVYMLWIRIPSRGGGVLGPFHFSFGFLLSSVLFFSQSKRGGFFHISSPSSRTEPKISSFDMFCFLFLFLSSFTVIQLHSAPFSLFSLFSHSVI